MDNTAHYTQPELNSTLTQHWAHPEANEGCCCSLDLAGIGWCKAGSLARRGLGAFYKILPRRSWQLSPVSPTQLCKQLGAHQGFVLLMFCHQGKYSANLAVSFFSGFHVTRADKPLSCLAGTATRTSWSKSAIQTRQSSSWFTPLAAGTALKVPQLHVFPMQSFCLNAPAIAVRLISAKWGSEYIHKKN